MALPKVPFQWAWGGVGHLQPGMVAVPLAPGPHPENHGSATTPVRDEGTSMDDPPNVPGAEPGLSPREQPSSAPPTCNMPSAASLLQGPRPPADSGAPGGGAGPQVPLLGGWRLGSIEHLLPAFHPGHGLHVLPPVAHLHGPLLGAGPTRVRGWLGPRHAGARRAAGRRVGWEFWATVVVMGRSPPPRPPPGGTLGSSRPPLPGSLPPAL